MSHYYDILNSSRLRINVSQNPIPRDAFMTLIFNECYPNNRPATSLRKVSSHRLSVLFMVFALGTLMDTRRPPCSIEAEEYHTLARACLCVEPVYDNSSLQAVQSMVCTKTSAQF